MAVTGRVSLSRAVWTSLLVVTIGLGLWGFAVVRQVVRPTAMDMLYRTARLFTLNLDVDMGVRPPWQLWVAAVLAPALVARWIAQLFREQLRSAVVQFLVTPHVVVFGANYRSAALIESMDLTGWQRWLRPVVVADPDPGQLATVRGPAVWAIPVDGSSDSALQKIAVDRAKNVIVVTGDDGRNATIATQAQQLPGRIDREIYVEIADPGLARALERHEDEKWVPFSSASLAAADVMDTLDEVDGPVLGSGIESPSLVIFGEGPLVDAVVLDLCRRRRVQLLAAPPRSESAQPRVLIVGPDAPERRDNLHTLLGDELDLLQLDVVLDSLSQAIKLRTSTARALLGHQVQRVLVLAADDLVGGPIALTLARHLGRDGRLALVTEGPASTFGNQIEEKTASDPTLAPVRVFRVPEIVYRLPQLRQQRTLDRLARALYQPGPDQPSWTDLTETDRIARRNKAKKLLDNDVSENPFMAFDPPQMRVLSGIEIDNFTALARAGLSPDLGDPRVLEKIGRRLLHDRRDGALEAWCEAARLSTDAAALSEIDVGRSGEADDVRRLLLIRRAQLKDSNARQELAANHDMTCPIGDLVIVVGGSGQDVCPDLRTVLDWALATTPPFTGTVVSPAGDTGAGRVLRELASAAHDSFTVVSPGVDAAAARRYALDIYARLVDGAPGTARVLAVPGDPTLWPQLQLLRTLGAIIGWLPLAPPGQPIPRPERQLLGGATGVVDLPTDRATVRAFLRPSRWTGSDTQRDLVAAALHAAYVRRHGARKPHGDPALRPFAQLSPALQNSNRAVVDDIPAKLAMVGLRLCPAADAQWPANWPDNATLELLAELEHGRWNAERLITGWETGTRDTGRFLSPYLKPWDELDDEAKQWDQEIIHALPAALHQAGLGASRTHEEPP